MYPLTRAPTGFFLQKLFLISAPSLFPFAPHSKSKGKDSLLGTGPLPVKLAGGRELMESFCGGGGGRSRGHSPGRLVSPVLEKQLEIRVTVLKDG